MWDFSECVIVIVIVIGLSATSCSGCVAFHCFFHSCGLPFFSEGGASTKTSSSLDLFLSVSVCDIPAPPSPLTIDVFYPSLVYLQPFRISTFLHAFHAQVFVLVATAAQADQLIPGETVERLGVRLDDSPCGRDVL